MDKTIRHKQNKRLIIGLGSGRCGTSSLSVLLSSQKNTRVPHEFKYPLPWNFSLRRILIKMHELNESGLNGDVAFYYLNFVRFLSELFPSTHFVCLQRDREETIESYMRKSENRNNWMEHDETVWEKNPWFYHSYPKFRVDSKKEAIGLYYDLYYETAYKLQTELPDAFRIFRMNDLNETDGVRNILHFCGFYLSEMIIQPGVHLNNTIK